MELVAVELRVNGDPVRVAVAPNSTLAELLRDVLKLTGTKQGCDSGECGACTVLLDGAPVLACLMLAAEAQGSSVTTVEGLARGTNLDRLQEAFMHHGAAQCGFCTPGMLLSARALLDRHPSASREEIKQALSGNLCRCTGYTKILDAVEDVARSSSNEGRR